MSNEDIFDSNQAEFYSVEVETIKKLLHRETPHMYLIKEGDKFKAETMTQAEYKEKYQKRNSVSCSYKYNVFDKTYGKQFSKHWVKEVF